MIGYFILGVCLLAALLLGGQWFVNADPRVLARTLRYGLAGVLAAIGFFLLATGRYGIGLALVGFAFMAAKGLGWFGAPSGPRRQEGASGQTSEVETDYLRMVLAHDTGEMSGEVLKGPYAGKGLAELDLMQLVAVLSACHREDPEAARLLETYLDRTMGPDWRDAAGASAGAGDTDSHAGTGRGQAGAAGQMTVDEAREILGVGPGASNDEIKEAYRRLMQKLHPDQGGSTYLAAKVNQAKDLLLRLR